jgi:hypothetical protein
LDRKARSGGNGSQLGVVRQKCVESNGVADVKSGGQMVNSLALGWKPRSYPQPQIVTAF